MRSIRAFCSAVRGGGGAGLRVRSSAGKSVEVALSEGKSTGSEISMMGRPSSLRTYQDIQDGIKNGRKNGPYSHRGK